MADELRYIERLPPGMRWPSGNYREVALLDVRGAYLSNHFGGDLVAGDEPGLGAWRAIGGKLKSGAVIELIEYLAQPEKGFALRADSSCDLQSVLDETLAFLGMKSNSV